MTKFIKPIFSLIFIVLILILKEKSQAQNQQDIKGKVPPVFNHQDSLRGTITPEREWWDLSYYHLSVRVNPDDSSIVGSNLIVYKVINPNQKMQIDLQPPMKITKITQNGVDQRFERDGNAWFVILKNAQKKGEKYELLVEFGGKPKVSRRPPWDGGISWKKEGLLL